MPVKATFGPSHAHVTEKQTVETYAWGFVLKVNAFNPNVPFGGRFHTQLQFVAWHVAPSRCCLSVTCQVPPPKLTGFVLRHLVTLCAYVSKAC